MKNIITTIAVAILVGCVSEQDYSGSYILTLGRGSVHFELKSDGSFVGSPEGQEDDAVGTWKVEGNLLVCDGATTKDSDRIKIKFHKTTFELISIAENGKEAPLDRMIPDGADGIFLEKIESNPSSAATQTTESAYLGDYSLTLPKETITLKLGSDDSFSLAGLGRGNIVGAWKEKGGLLVCEGTTEQDSDRITLEFDKETFKLISLARNGREAPLSEWTHGTGEIYLRQNTGSPKTNHTLLDAGKSKSSSKACRLARISMCRMSLEANHGRRCLARSHTATRRSRKY